MEKLPMCRICLVENVRMYVVVNKNLHELYEKLTDVPFVTEDSRPILACFFCCTKLKQCFRFLRKCLEAEEIFAQIRNEGCETDPLINPEHLEFFNGFINCPVVHISINSDGQTESDAIKEGLPAVWERLDEIIDPKEEQQTDELDLKNVDNSYSDVKVTRAHHSESDSEDVPLMEIKTEVEDEQESIGAPAAKKPNLVPHKEDMEKFLPFKHKNNGQEHSKNPKNSKNMYFKSLNKTEKAISSRTVIKDKPKVTNDTICNKKDSLRTNSKEITALLQCDKINKDEFKCKVSNYNGINSSDIKTQSFRHKNVCAKDRQFKCNICQSSFSAKSHLNVHVRIHTGDKPYKCDVCLRSFSKKANLNVHIRIHTGEKLYKCDICQSRFNTKKHLNDHIRIHTGEKPFKCDICWRSFNQKTNLNVHIRTHTGEKPYKCDICQKSFRRKGHLNGHIRIHTGEKPYK